MISVEQVSLSLEGARLLAHRAFPDDGKGSHWTDDPSIELPIKIGPSFPSNIPPVSVPVAFTDSVKRYHSLPAMRVVRSREFGVRT